MSLSLHDSQIRELARATVAVIVRRAPSLLAAAYPPVPRSYAVVIPCYRCKRVIAETLSAVHASARHLLALVRTRGEVREGGSDLCCRLATPGGGKEGNKSH